MQTAPNILLRHNRNISKRAYQKAHDLRQRISKAVEAREEYVRQKNLDRDFCFPEANWNPNSPNDFFEAYRHLRDGGYDVVNRLRFWSQAFSGYSIMHMRPGAGLRSVNDIPDNYDSWIVQKCLRPDFPIDAWKSLIGVLPRRYRFNPPVMLGEIGWRFKRKIVNYDVAAYQERVAILFEAGIFDRLRSLGRRPRILEIGGGYGALALALMKMTRAEEYVICDLPEALLFSGMYLALAQHRNDVSLAFEPYHKFRGFTLLPNYKFHQLMESGGKFDLVINTISMSEMSVHQVQKYAEGIGKLLSNGSSFFEQNVAPGKPGAFHYCKDVIKDYLPIRHDIETLLWQPIHGIPTLWSNT